MATDASLPISNLLESWGTQIGAEAVDLVMVIKSEKGMQKLGCDSKCSAYRLG
jgi:lipid-binding SYLF domain-containing protein